MPLFQLITFPCNLSLFFNTWIFLFASGTKTSECACETHMVSLCLHLVTVSLCINTWAFFSSRTLMLLAWGLCTGCSLCLTPSLYPNSYLLFSLLLNYQGKYFLTSNVKCVCIFFKLTFTELHLFSLYLYSFTSVVIWLVSPSLSRQEILPFPGQNQI